MLRMKKCFHFLKFHQKLTKQSDIIFLILCIFHLVLDTFFWTCIKCSDWDCTKTSQPIIFWVGAFKGNSKKPLGTLNKTLELFFKTSCSFKPSVTELLLFADIGGYFGILLGTSVYQLVDSFINFLLNRRMPCSES